MWSRGVKVLVCGRVGSRTHMRQPPHPPHTHAPPPPPTHTHMLHTPHPKGLQFGARASTDNLLPLPPSPPLPCPPPPPLSPAGQQPGVGDGQQQGVHVDPPGCVHRARTPARLQGAERGVEQPQQQPPAHGPRGLLLCLPGGGLIGDKAPRLRASRLWTVRPATARSRG